MKKIFTFAIALLSMFAMLQPASALVYTATVPAGTNACFIAGDFPAPMSWAPSAEGARMTMVDATHYTIDLPLNTAAMAYKYCSGPDWAFVEKDADGNELAANRTYAAGVADVVLKWAAVWDPNVIPVPMNVTIDVLTPKGTNECYIVGTFNKWAGPTAPADSIKMLKLETKPDGTVVFEKTIFTDDANKLAYHFCSGPDWSFEQKAPTGDYKYPEVAPIVTEWKAIFDPATVGNVNIVATVPATGTGDHVFIQGGFSGWSWGSPKEMTKNINGTYSYLINNIASTEYKIYNGSDWGFVEVDAAGVEVANRSVTATPQQTITVNISVIGWKTFLALRELNADNYKVYTNGHSIVVEGVKSQVNVFDVSGRNIQSVKTTGTFSSNNLNAGLYILVVDGASRKVAVK